MKDQKHIKSILKNGEWFRPRGAQLRGERIVCDLGATVTYGLLDAYASEPHIEFAKSLSTSALEKFVKKWGPINFRNRSGVDSCDIDVAEYKQLQRWIIGLLSTVAAVRSGEGVQAALARLVMALQEQFPAVVLEVAFTWAKVPRDLVAWAQSLTDREAIQETDKALKLCFFEPDNGPMLSIVWTSREIKIQASRKFDSLGSALVWMIWQDVNSETPIYACQECKVLFRGRTAHRRSFCSERCARNQTAREWARRRSAEKAAEKVEANGTAQKR